MLLQQRYSIWCCVSIAGCPAIRNLLQSTHVSMHNSNPQAKRGLQCHTVTYPLPTLATVAHVLPSMFAPSCLQVAYQVHLGAGRAIVSDICPYLLCNAWQLCGLEHSLQVHMLTQALQCICWVLKLHVQQCHIVLCKVYGTQRSAKLLLKSDMVCLCHS